MIEEDFAMHTGRIHEIVYETVAEFDGSFSAEHGIGQQKKSFMPVYRSEVELGLMRKLKATLDPNNLMNPGKVL